jgi:hypothetical protein
VQNEREGVAYFSFRKESGALLSDVVPRHFGVPVTSVDNPLKIVEHALRTAKEQAHEKNAKPFRPILALDDVHTRYHPDPPTPPSSPLLTRWLVVG